MASGVGSIAGIGAVDDSRLHADGRDNLAFPTRLATKLHDSSIPFEEYLHYAKMTRAEEDRLYGPGSDYTASTGPAMAFVKEKILRKRVEHRRESIPQPRLSISAQGEGQITRADESDSANEKNGHEKQKFEPMTISDEEWVQASRAARTATW